MSDYIEREALLELYTIEDLPEREGGYVVPVDNVRQNIIDQPAADVVEVVRCKDCVFGHCWYEIINGVSDSWVECQNPEGLNRDVSLDEYCSASIKRVSEE